MQSNSPRFLIVSGVRKTQVKKIATVSPASADESQRHRDGHFIIVPGPAAIEIESYFAFRLTQHALHQVVLVGKSAGHASGAAEYLGILPNRIKRDDAP